MSHESGCKTVESGEETKAGCPGWLGVEGRGSAPPASMGHEEVDLCGAGGRSQKREFSDTGTCQL